jgi:hypothetical protein
MHSKMAQRAKNFVLPSIFSMVKYSTFLIAKAEATCDSMAGA